MTDSKLAEAALIASTSRSVAIASWHALLESCACANSHGRFETTPRRVAAALCEPVAIIEALFAGFVEVGMVLDGTVCAWSKRQFESDNSTERSRKHRSQSRNVDATLQQQDATAPYTETDTQTEKKEDSEDKSSAPDDETDLFRRGREVLGPSGGGLTAKLLKAKGGKIPLARAALEMAADKHNPREWIGAHLSQSDDKRPWPKGFKPKPGDKKDWPEDFHPPPGAKVRRLQFDDGTVNWDFEQHAM